MWFVIALPIVVGGGIAVTRWVKRRMAEAEAGRGWEQPR
jgi:hypothetical protein